MPNSKQRKKKDGENVGKKIERSREASRERHEREEQEQQGLVMDKGDHIAFKPGSADDRTHQNANRQGGRLG
jgi:hypothetical protein